MARPRLEHYWGRGDEVCISYSQLCPTDFFGKPYNPLSKEINIQKQLNIWIYTVYLALLLKWVNPPTMYTST